MDRKLKYQFMIDAQSWILGIAIVIRPEKMFSLAFLCFSWLWYFEREWDED